MNRALRQRALLRQLRTYLAATLFFVALSTCPLVAQAPPAPTESAAQQSTPATQSPEKNKQEQDQNEAYKHSAVVQMLGGKLGMTTDQAAVAFEVANFVVLALLVAWLLVKTLPGRFRDRTSFIQKSLVDARAATEEASARLKSVEGRLSQLDSQIAELRSKAEKDLAVEEVRVRNAIEGERKKILAAAEQEIASATAQARRQIQQYAAELAVDQAAKKLTVSAETDRLLVQEFAARVAGRRGEEN